MLTDVKLALRISGTAFDTEIQLLIDDCILELAGLGITANDAQTKVAVISYCKWKFGSNSDSDKWEKNYHDKVAKLMSMSGYGLPAEDNDSAEEEQEEENDG